SVVLRLLVGEPRAQAEAAWSALAEIRATGGEVFVSDLVMSETYFALRYHYRVPKKEAVRQLRTFLGSGHVISSGRAGDVLETPDLATAKPGFVDRMIHAGYLQQYDAMLTFEKAARKLGRTRMLEALPPGG